MTSNIFLGTAPVFITTKYLLRETDLIEELLMDKGMKCENLLSMPI